MALVDCFTREERNGIHMIFPLAGPKKQNCLLVNSAVRTVYEHVRQGSDLATIIQDHDAWAQQSYREALEDWDESEESGRPQPPSEKQVRFDLYRSLLMLRDHALCDFDFSDLMTLLPQGTGLPGTSQLMPVCRADKTSEFLMRAISAEDEAVQPFFCAPDPSHLIPGYFQTEQLIRRHLCQEEVYFIQLDDDGEVEACSVIGGFATQPQSLTAALVAARHDSEAAFRETMGTHFARVCGLLSIVTLSAMIRMQYPTGENADVYLAPCFKELIGELGFRRSFDLPTELGEASGIVGYDKPLV